MKLFLNGRVIASLLAMTFYLAACGDGGSLPGNAGPVAEVDPKVSSTDVPTSATTSATGAFTFVKMVVESSADAAEPLVLGDAVLATTDTEEPDPSV
jgi:hypothetical protein